MRANHGSCYVWSPEGAQKKLGQRVHSPFKTEICVYPDDNGNVDFNEPTWIDIKDRALIVLDVAGVYVQVLFDEKILWIHDHDFYDCFNEC